MKCIENYVIIMQLHRICIVRVLFRAVSALPLGPEFLSSSGELRVNYMESSIYDANIVSCI